VLFAYRLNVMLAQETEEAKEAEDAKEENAEGASRA